jgi:hypothetical protein
VIHLHLAVGDTCGLWQAPTDPDGSDSGFANLSLWDVAPPDALCANAGSNDRGDWIANGYPDLRVLNGDPPGSMPTFVCADTGTSARDWFDLADQEGTVQEFPVNDCNGQVDTDGVPAPVHPRQARST